MTFEQFTAEKAAEITVAFIENTRGTAYALKDADAVNDFFTKVFKNIYENMSL